ncbi:MAG: hypothetical protein K0R01_470 [Mycobacterium sp.]|nr:hypothetical protein [Mycobacterium sp.]
MTPSPTSPATVLRGAAVGTLTAALAAAAHAGSGGGLPSGAGAVQLAVLAVVVGGFVVVVRGGHRFLVLTAAMGAGQLLGHALLSASGHHHGAAASGVDAAMLAAHVGALVAVAALVTVGELSCRAISRTVRAAVLPPAIRVPAGRTAVFRRCDHPLRSVLQLAASLSHRGPPVSAR